ncbi:hypothetical protein QUF90_13755 [Desulfococcaceae bacterium HSG9]|nr:hypothetical protein [Desulfococcaceae bacterium HSG9]
MTPSGILFFVFGLMCAGYASKRRVLGDKFLPLKLFAYHLGFSLLYWWYSLNNPADSTRYYSMAKSSINLPLGFGTAFIGWFVQKIYLVFEPSYLDFFLLFHIAGFIGMCLFVRTVMDVSYNRVLPRVKQAMLILFFLPGLHYWTSAIGKDSLIFLGINLSIWGLLKPRRRGFASLAGFLIMYLVRPHVAGFFLMAVILSLMWGRGVPLRWRIIGTLGVLAVLLKFLLPVIMDFVGLSVLSPESLDGYFEKRRGHNMSGGGGVDIRGYPFILKFLTYLYRPFFIDAPGLLGLIVSCENAVLLWFSILLLSKPFWFLLWKHRFSFFMRFNFFFFFIGTTVFCMTTANMGIAIRQKTMLLPSLIILVLTAYEIKKYGLTPYYRRKSYTIRRWNVQGRKKLKI